MSLPFSELISGLTDQRVDRTKVHEFSEIMVIAMCSTICFGEGWVDMERFGKCKKEWLKTFLTLKGGTPSDDTFRRVISSIEPDKFEECFQKWVGSIVKKFPEVIAIDGKTIRGSGDGVKKPLHIVSAWANANRMVLGQVATEEKSNEITAIPKLLESLVLEGCVVTIDAMGCQRKIATKIIDMKADYIFGLKGNQGNLNDNVRLYMDDFIEHHIEQGFTHINSGHGRIEKRTTWFCQEVDWLEEKGSWKGLSGFVAIETERTVKGVTSKERRYYITSLKGVDAEGIGEKIREHWGIENSLHWCLDVTFGEDDCTIRKKNGAQNISLIRKLVMNMLRNDPEKESIRGKRKKAGWSNQYLADLLGI